MIDLTAFDEPLTADLDPRVWVEPKDRVVMSEDERQAVFVAMMKRVAKRCDVAANTNAAKRTRWAAAKVKREGLVNGRNDLDVKWTGAVALIEFKNGRSMLEPAQVEYLNRMAAMEFPVAVCRTAAGAMGWLRSIGAPVPVMA